MPFAANTQEEEARLDEVAAVQAWMRSADAWRSEPAGWQGGLALAVEGMRLRRQLDATANPTALRRALVRKLADVSDLLITIVKDALGSKTPAATPLPEAVRQHLADLQVELAEVLTSPDRSALARAAMLQGFRRDLQWWQALVATLEGEPPPAASLTLRVALDHLHDELAAIDATDDPRRGELLDGCSDLRHALLQRRLRREIQQPLEEPSVARLWTRRFILSRLQAELASSVDSDQPDPNGRPHALHELLAQVAEYRRQIAETAWQRLIAMPPDEALAAWDELVVAARGDMNEVAAFLQDLPPAKAVRILENAETDFVALDRLGRDLRRHVPDMTRRQVAKMSRLYRWVRNELQEKRLSCRLEGWLGRRFVGWMEGTVLALVLVMVALITAEGVLEKRVGLSPAVRAWFAWVDLAICSVFLAEFAFKWSQATGKWLYVRRRFLVDVIASLPYGFIAYAAPALEAGSVTAESAPNLLRMLRFLRLPALARYLQAARPMIRVARLLIFFLRATDHLVWRNARLLNRSIVLFEPEKYEDEEGREKHLLRALRSHWMQRTAELQRSLTPAERLQLCTLAMEDVKEDFERLGDAAPPPVESETRSRASLRVEAVVQQLVEMTPERIIDVMGQPFAESVRRYVRLLDVPLVRRLPVIRELVVARDRSSADVAALFVNHLGHVLQWVLEVIYFVADLHGTISGPIFLDRLGATIVTATAGPTKRLLTLGATLLLLYFLVWAIGIGGIILTIVRKMETTLALPVIILGALCAIPLLLGIWLRRIANQAAEQCERVVEAQFAAQTKATKLEHRAMDTRVLAERVIAPELELRSGDDRPHRTFGRLHASPGRPLPRPAEYLLMNDELLFLRHIELLYQDYLDGSLFHRNDTRTTTQLLGNLALTNLRLSNLEHALWESKRLRSLDLNRAGTLFGGPYLWFNYVTRAITQQTAELLVDYNLHAVPQVRLAYAAAATRDHYRQWLSRRLGIPCEQVQVPDPEGDTIEGPRAEPPGCSASVVEGGQSTGAVADAMTPRPSKRPEAERFFETVDFNAMDFLTAHPDRDAELEAKYGPQVAALLRRDRRANVRRAFRSFPLHQVPLAQRTLNPFTLYNQYLARGRVLLLPFHAMVWSFRLVRAFLRSVVTVVRDLINPHRTPKLEVPFDSYAVARRKIHRMRKPVFMQSLWLRARFDVEYLGLPLPGIPMSLGSDSLLERDLDFIGASRRERLQAEQLYQIHHERLVRITQWLERLGWTFEKLPEELANRFPYLADKSAEVIRALVTAMMLDHDDVFTLALAIEAVEVVVAYASKPENDARQLPAGLPPPVHPSKPLWHPLPRRSPPIEGLFALPRFSSLTPAQQGFVVKYVRKHRANVRGWIDVLLSQGGPDPLATLRDRLVEVIRRTDLWSDQILALRTVHTLAMLDVYHYCEMVWKLGGYEESKGEAFDAELPLGPLSPHVASTVKKTVATMETANTFRARPSVPA